jgi:5-methyltetrahydropteroyltriglutamate--homocysteine methyltransferase
VIDCKSNFVEHPEVVAQRIEAVVAAVGDRERVVAGVVAASARLSDGNG